MEQDFTEQEEHDLWLWSIAQARDYHNGKLSKEQIAKLQAIDFPFETYWQEYCEYSHKYQEELNQI